MTRPRRELVSPSETQYYHCVSRCVRRAYLCGRDALSGRDLSHRRMWIVRRMKLLAKVFMIEVCAYAIMSNHYHLVLRLNTAQASSLSDEDVISRWRRLYKISPSIQDYIDGIYSNAADMDRSRAQVILWRQRLADLSWYMRALNEYIARRANAEDECTGRFWEGRFKSQALLDEQALLACMVYVDLNPVRAGRAITPEASEFTSVAQRIRALGRKQGAAARGRGHRVWCPLAAFQDSGAPSVCIPYKLKDYLELVDWSGRVVRNVKGQSIPAKLPPILQRLGIDAGGLVNHLCRKGPRFLRVMGTVERIRQLARRWRLTYFKGMNAARALFGDEQTSPTTSLV